MKRQIYIAALATASLIGIGSAYAAKSIENDALSIATAKISLTQAIAAAEKHVGGTAARAEFEKDQGHWVFDIEVVTGHKVMDVKVDSSTGRILAASEDQADREGQPERDEDD